MFDEFFCRICMGLIFEKFSPALRLHYLINFVLKELKELMILYYQVSLLVLA